MDVDPSKAAELGLVDDDGEAAAGSIFVAAPTVRADISIIRGAGQGKRRDRDRSDDRTDEEREAEDAKELFAAALALGQEIEQYDLDHQAVIRAFTRGENWAEALDEIRKILKGHFEDPHRPMHRALAKWRVLDNRLLPFVTRYAGLDLSRKPEEAEEAYELLYGVGKILVFLTFPLQRYTSEPHAHAQDLRDNVVAIARHRQFLPSFVSSLLDPALDPSPKDRTPKEMRAVDLVVTVLKQLAQVPNGAAADVAGTAELLVLAFEREGVLRLLAALCSLLARRDFERFSLTTLELVFCLLRGQDPEALFTSARRVARGQVALTPTTFDAAIAAAGAGAGAAAGAAAGAVSPAKASSAGAGVGAGARRSVSPTLPGAASRLAGGAGAMPGSASAAAAAAALKVTTNRAAAAVSNASRAADPLRALMAAQQHAKAAAVQAAGTARHSRFGTMAQMAMVTPSGIILKGSAASSSAAGAGAGAGGGGPAGALEKLELVTRFRGNEKGTGIVAAPASGHATTAVQKYHPGQARRPPPRRSKHAELKPELRIEIDDGVGASKPVSTGKAGPPGAAAAAAGAGSGLAPSDTFASAATVDRARAALYAFAQALLAVPREAASEPASAGAGAAAGSAAGAAGAASNVITIDDDEDDDASEAPPVPFRCLADTIKAKLVRGSDDTLEREDTLRYAHAAGVILGAHRVAEMHRVREQRDEAIRLLKAAAAWKIARERSVRARADIILAREAADKATAAAAAAATAAADDEEAELGAILARFERPAGDAEDEGSGAAAAPAAPAASPAQIAAAIATARAAMPPLSPHERLFELALAAGVHVPGISADAVETLLDNFSTQKLASDGMQGSLDRKEWEALGIYAGYAKEILHFVHVLLAGEGHGAEVQAQAGRDTHYSWRFAAGALATDLSSMRGESPSSTAASLASPSAPGRASAIAPTSPASAGGSKAALALRGTIAAETVLKRRSGAVVLPAVPTEGISKRDTLAAATCPVDAIAAVLEDWLGRNGATTAEAILGPAVGASLLAGTATGSSKPRYRPAALPKGGYDLGEVLRDQFFREGAIVTVVPTVLRHYEPGRLDASCLASLLEASDFAVRLVTQAAASGLQSAVIKGSKSSKGKAKRKGVRFDEGDDDADSDNGAGAGSGTGDGNAGNDGYGSLVERSRFVLDFAHPAVVQAANTMLRNYRSNSPRINFCAVRLMDCLAALSNEYAGTHPKTGKPLTYATMLYHQSLLGTARKMLNDLDAEAALLKNAPSAIQFRDVLPWAKRLWFLIEDSLDANPLLLTEGLFWKPEKTAHAELARHYGHIDGDYSRFGGEDGDKYEPSTAASGRGGAGRVTAAAAERNAAEAQAAAYREARASGEGGGEAEEEAVFRDDDDDDDALGRLGAGGAKRRQPHKDKARGAKGRRGRGRGSGSDSSGSGSDGSSSDASSSSGSSRSRRSSTSEDTSTLTDSSDDDKGGKGGKGKRSSSRKARIARKKLASAAAAGAGAGAGGSAAKRRRLTRGAGSGSDSDSDDAGAGAGSSGSRAGGAGGAWLPSEDSALRSLFPCYAALALAGAAAQTASLSSTAESKGLAIAAQLLSREPELQRRKRAAADVRSRCVALGLRLPAVSADASGGSSGGSSDGSGAGSPSAAHVQPLRSRIAEGVAGLFVALGRSAARAAATTGAGSSSSSGSAAASSTEYFNEDDGMFRADADADADASGTAAAAWLADALRRAAHARAAAERRAAAEAAAVSEVAATQPAAASQAAVPASGDAEVPASFAGFSQSGATFQAAVAALLAGGDPPADIPEEALAAAAAQLGVEWQPRRAAAAAASSSSAAASSNSGSSGAGAGAADDADAAGAAALSANLPDIPVVPVLPSHFTWFASPAFTALLASAGVCRAGGAAQRGEIWWRIPGPVPSAALFAASEALAAAAAGRSLVVATASATSGAASVNSAQRQRRRLERLDERLASASRAGADGASASSVAKPLVARSAAAAPASEAASDSDDDVAAARAAVGRSRFAGRITSAAAAAAAAASSDSDDDSDASGTGSSSGSDSGSEQGAGAAPRRLIRGTSDAATESSSLAAPRRLVRGTAAGTGGAGSAAAAAAGSPPSSGTGGAGDAASSPAAAPASLSVRQGRKKAIAIDDDDDE